MELPDQRLLYIMTILYRKEKTPLYKMLSTPIEAPGASPLLSMIIVAEYELIENLEKGVFVRSAEQNPCPCCNGSLKVIGSRHRGFINDAGNKNVLVIRRLRCCHCHRIHHELPDILVPYKRHSSESIESVITGNDDPTVATDESTIGRWRNWFVELSDYILGCLISIMIRYGRESVEGISNLPKSTLQRIWHYVERYGGKDGRRGKIYRINLNK